MTNITRKTSSLILCLTLLFFAVMAGTLAWSDFSQHSTNVFVGSTNSSVVLYLYEKDINEELTNNLIEGTEFYLYKKNSDDSVTQIGGSYVTDKDGKINVNGLTAGDYYFLQVNPMYGYTYDRDSDNTMIKEYHFTITEGDIMNKNTIERFAYNRKLYAPLTLTKIVETENQEPLTEEQKNRFFEFTLTFSDGGTYHYRVTDGDDTGAADGSFAASEENDDFNTASDGEASFSDENAIPFATEGTVTSGDSVWLKHGQTIMIEDLPVGVQYSIVETDYVEDGYYTFSTGSSGNLSISGAEAEFTNVFSTIAHGLADLSITKKIKNTDNSLITDKQKDDLFEFTVIFNDGGMNTYQYSVDGGSLQDITSGSSISLKHGETAVIKDVPIGTQYVVVESDYYSKHYLGYMTGGVGSIMPGTNKAVQTNTFISVQTEITGQKTWMHGSNPKAKQPTSIKVHLLADGVVYAVKRVTAADDWAYSFTAPKYASDGREIIYSIDEAQILDYIRIVDGFNITNEYIGTTTEEPTTSAPNDTTNPSKDPTNPTKDSTNPTVQTSTQPESTTKETTGKTEETTSTSKPKDTVSTSKSGNSNGLVDSPKTGDNNMLWLLLLIILVSGATISFLWLSGNKTKKD